MKIKVVTDPKREICLGGVREDKELVVQGRRRRFVRTFGHLVGFAERSPLKQSFWFPERSRDYSVERIAENWEY